MDNIKILIVDDNKRFSDNLVKYFKNMLPDSDVKTVYSGEEALFFVQDNNPDLIFMDISLPGINGLDTVKKIKENKRSSKVVMLTLFDNDEYRKTAFGYGADGYICKSEFGNDSLTMIEELFKN